MSDYIAGCHTTDYYDVSMWLDLKVNKSSVRSVGHCVHKRHLQTSRQNVCIQLKQGKLIILDH